MTTAPSRLRVAFAGTPDFARTALESLAAAGVDIVLVLTQPDRPAGRGMKLQAAPVKQAALQSRWPIAQPRSLRLDGKFADDALAARQALADAQADVLVVAAYGLILPPWVLDTPRLGCLNIHASLLPRWRGAAPIHRAVEAGDAETGVTIMQMDAGLDTGAMLLADSLAIGDDSTARLHDRLATLGGRLIVEALRRLQAGALPATPQPPAGVSYAHKVEKSEAPVDWAQPATVVARRIRAFDPFPGATGVIDGETIKLWAATARPGTPGAIPGTILAAGQAGIEVAAIDSIAIVTELQRAGGRRLPAGEWLRGFALRPGQAFGR